MKTPALKEISFLLVCLFIALPTCAGERPTDSTHIPYTETINIECSQIASFVGEFKALVKEGKAQAAFCLGLVYEEEGFREDAINWFRKALELKSERARTKLISIFQTIDRREVAALYFDAALRDIKPYRYALAKLSYKHWKETREEKFLIFTWVWLAMDDYLEFREDEKPYRSINVDSLLNTEQREQALVLLNCFNQLVEDYGGIDGLKIKDSSVANSDNWMLLISDCRAFGESQHPD